MHDSESGESKEEKPEGEAGHGKVVTSVYVNHPCGRPRKSAMPVGMAMMRLTPNVHAIAGASKHLVHRGILPTRL